ncbi:DUF448 domain-containing protein [Altererythrobacter sp. KTW20L]|uniref:DUF448 domain-containing protein n=1 Tax=Altererythrobacter sp. KTW20L TaxID=2942210 RepID=UPI0020BFB443|nr:DUF448 domain-containing protein [Altererythrobacter sp. KTW20L]MCL6252224.1 DUF448 domain-containing protein [Altererythrobacter sp. KTW20L]
MRNPRNEPLGSPARGKRAASARDGSGDTPERRCVLTGRTSARDDLIRLAISPEGQVLPDALARAPGRGAWIGVDKAALAEALGNGKLKGALARAFKGAQLVISPDLPDLVEAAVRRAFLDRLGLEFRSGKLLLGSDKIANEARMGKVSALFHAADASQDGARKLDQAWRVGTDREGSGATGERLPLDREALSVALGRDNVVHLALVDHASAQRVMVPLRRLQTFLGAAGPEADGSGVTPADEAAGAADTIEFEGLDKSV